MTRHLIKWAANCYPATWRKRYGEEFEATVEDMPALGWAAVWDVWKGAMAMQVQYGPNLKKMVAIFGLVGLALAWGVSLRIPDLYISQSTVQATNLEAKSLDQSVRKVLSRSSLSYLLLKHKLFESERTHMPLEDVIEMMSKRVSVKIATTAKDASKPAFTVGFAYEDAAAAQRVTDDLSSKIIEDYRSTNAAANGASLLTVLDSASRPDPIYPNRPVFALTGMLGGALLGTFWALFKRRKA